MCYKEVFYYKKGGFIIKTPKNALFIKRGCYLSLYETFRELGNDFGNDISLYDYVHSCTMYAFNIKPSYDCSYEPDQGHVKFSIHFKQPLTEAVCFLVHAEKPCLMEITGTRNVTLK